jgi:23S rRNA pseudouridine955/2504/2580 synthase/23S rRNA pseudouridine1911/1915/1917 synthase
LILFAKNEASHRYFSKLFEERKIEKHYVGVVMGCPSNQSGIIEAPITEHLINKGMMIVHRSGKPSSTSYRVIESHPTYSLVSFQLHTGRTHQIRVHAQNIGHPLACDPLYGDGKPVLLSTIKKKYKLSKHDDEERPMINRVALHSHQLIFQDESMQPFNIIADIPKEFTALLQQLRKNG